MSNAGSGSFFTPTDFERVVGFLFASMGHRVEHVGGRGDGGIDLKLYRKGALEIVQCKFYAGQVGPGHIRDFYGAMQHENAARGHFVTSGTFSPSARGWAEGKPIELIDGAALRRLIAEGPNTTVTGDPPVSARRSDVVAPEAEPEQAEPAASSRFDTDYFIAVVNGVSSTWNRNSSDPAGSYLVEVDVTIRGRGPVSYRLDASHFCLRDSVGGAVGAKPAPSGRRYVDLGCGETTRGYLLFEHSSTSRPTALEYRAPAAVAAVSFRKDVARAVTGVPLF